MQLISTFISEASLSFTTFGMGILWSESKTVKDDVMVAIPFLMVSILLIIRSCDMPCTVKIPLARTSYIPSLEKSICSFT